MGRTGSDAVRGPWVAGAVVAGRYRLERLLGEGGMGVVWAATHTVTRRPVALKFLTAGERSMQARRRFMREARAAAAARHPNVIDIYDFLELEAFYLAPEQVFGKAEIDHRVDLWALGLILYQCLSGRVLVQ